MLACMHLPLVAYYHAIVNAAAAQPPSWCCAAARNRTGNPVATRALPPTRRRHKRACLHACTHDERPTTICSTAHSGPQSLHYTCTATQASPGKTMHHHQRD
ncbi:hypothetical protein COO60DRAFT_1527355 [Scenedesmus sp. NREL 46B-D3]|nr:hypothetical protein COO60DRAFT_1527355 [Scenedesmus sp. NREL 46B-D3]